MRAPIDVLLVDDEPRNLDALEAILSDPGYRLLRAEDADRALHLLLGNDIAAIVLDRISELGTLGERLLGAADPGAALLEFLTAAAHQRQQRDLSFLQGAGELNPEVTRVRGQMFQTVHALVERARQQGTVRADVTGTDVILLMCAPNYVTSYLPDAPPDLWQRYLAIIFDGLRAEGAHPLPHPPPASP